jgi:hypothetical protein
MLTNEDIPRLMAKGNVSLAQKIEQEVFSLTNKPQRRVLIGELLPPEVQTVLFAGMNCLPGQLDLFQTDGQQ